MRRDMEVVSVKRGKISHFCAVELAQAAETQKFIPSPMLRTFPHKFMYVYLLNRFKFSTFSLTVSLLSQVPHTQCSHLSVNN